MNKKWLILILAAAATFSVDKKLTADQSGLLRDGFIISGVDGRISNEKNSGKWFFALFSDVNDGVGRIEAGSKLEILPSVALEKIENNMAKHPGDNYRLWARVTRYSGKNYIYGIYFLPVTEVAPAAGTGNVKISINESNDPLAIPEEVVAKLKNKKIIHPEELEKGIELKDDSILADRTGFIAKSGTGGTTFVLDALGRNRGNLSLELLPCEILEQSLSKEAGGFNKTRVNVAGIVTRYKGRYYLLLQRATPVYSYGNFE